MKALLIISALILLTSAQVIPTWTDCLPNSSWKPINASLTAQPAVGQPVGLTVCGNVKEYFIYVVGFYISSEKLFWDLVSLTNTKIHFQSDFCMTYPNVTIPENAPNPFVVTVDFISKVGTSVSTAGCIAVDFNYTTKATGVGENKDNLFLRA